MPPSIDPISNLFSTGAGLVSRVVVFFLAGAVGTWLSFLVGCFYYWSDFIEIWDSINGSEWASVEALGYLFLSVLGWGLVIIEYLLEVPLYGLFLLIAIPICGVRIILTDDPVLFWACLMVALILPGEFIGNWSFPGLAALVVVGTGVGAALWYAINLDYPEWIDWFREKTGM